MVTMDATLSYPRCREYTSNAFIYIHRSNGMVIDFLKPGYYNKFMGSSFSSESKSEREAKRFYARHTIAMDITRMNSVSLLT